MTHIADQDTKRLPTGWPSVIEWGTLGLIALCYLLILIAVFVLPAVSIWSAAALLIFALVLHSSLTHEVCHGHPLPSRFWSQALVHPNPGLAIPYLRFRDTHLAHHHDANLTDPYDDPESNYLDPAQWIKMPAWLKVVRRMNNTLAGRIVLGPAIGQISFMTGDWTQIRSGNRQILKSWAIHIVLAGFVVSAVSASDFPILPYLGCCYVALSVLKIRTFLEHQAHDRARGRTVIIEDRGLLAFLFLNNNLHVVHHMHPRVPWYSLPRVYAENRARYLQTNDGYVYRSYGQIFTRFFWRCKDPVPHPLWRSEDK